MQFKHMWNRINPTMDKYVLFCVWMWSGIPLTLSECPGVSDLMIQAEECAVNLHQYKTQTLTGQLDYQNKAEACNAYEDAESCTDAMVTACREENSPDVYTAEVVLSDLQNGFGKLCAQDTRYFDRYMANSKCFQRVSNRTGHCLETFNKELKGEMDYVNYKTDEDPMCRSIEKLVNCVTEVVRPACGKSSAEIFVDMCMHQVPESLSGHCNPSPLPGNTPTTDTATPTEHSKYYISLAVAVSVLLLSSHW